jgi:hypothetical protein
MEQFLEMLLHPLREPLNQVHGLKQHELQEQDQVKKFLNQEEYFVNMEQDPIENKLIK